MVDLTAFLQTTNATVRNVLEKLDLNRAGIVLIVDSDDKLLQTITDGDVRRAMLAGVVPTDTIQTLLDHKRQTLSPTQPISAANTTSIAEQRQLMQQHSIRQLPLLDEAGRVTHVALLNELLSQEASNLPLTAVIMAGGLGTRLRPLTLDTPKPMLLVGERPIMEWVILGLRRSGIREFIITTHYLPEQITSHFGDGSKWGVQIEYLNEDNLTGTAGPLLKMSPWDRALLVTNSDLLTNLDYGAMYQFHQEQEALITVAMREYFVQVPYGTIDLDGSRLTGLTEKPSLPFYINAGIYFLEPEVYDELPQQDYLDMTDVVEIVIERKRKVSGFTIREYWLDIGQHTQYEQAQNDIHRLGL